MLRSGNGAVNTLATEGNYKFDFTVQNDGEDVTLETDFVTAKVMGTLKDSRAIYSLQGRWRHSADAPVDDDSEVADFKNGAFR
ncbi:hypothetical protein Bca52824_000769 [Brassica carinata]|uniref:Uncharacterized protein n=1 Tax=Brassica carinata TaxID=52824 RepID=A0A8X8B962_BRACI|nr:hypothetical protein Bca52824_000769 [Brassica carinata]